MRYKVAESQVSDIHFRSLGKGLNDELLGRGVLGDSLGALTDSVLGQLTREEETDSSLDLSAGDGGTPVVVGQTACLSSNTLEDVVHEGVHDGHGLAGDSSVRVDLLQHLVDVDGIAFLPPPLALLVTSPHGLSLRGGLLGSLGCGFGRHVVCRRAANTVRANQQLFYL